ncbi:MAG: hypothetical protein GY906_13310, partial [bacterium]|nr:hypothetical protein [bacterium]
MRRFLALVFVTLLAVRANAAPTDTPNPADSERELPTIAAQIAKMEHHEGL